MAETYTTKMLIIGSGPAGYTAAIYAARANLKPMLISGSQPGGQLTITTDVENYPGFADPIQGPWLMEQMKGQAEYVGTDIKTGMIVDVDFTSQPKKATDEDGNTYLADTIVIATGAQARWLGLPSEEAYKGYGVSACATCDGFFYREKPVIVVGGGNSAVEEALFLTNFASKVTLVHRRDSLRAEKIMQERLFNHPKIEVIWDGILDEVLGTPVGGEGIVGVTGARLRNIKTDDVQDIPVDGIFIAIGHDPATKVFKGHLDMDDEGYILGAPDSSKTSVAGVYAAGDVKDKIYRQAVTAAGMGCMAALEADKFIADLNANQKKSAA